MSDTFAVDVVVCIFELKLLRTLILIPLEKVNTCAVGNFDPILVQWCNPNGPRDVLHI